MERGLKVSYKTPIKHSTAGRIVDREFSINKSKLCWPSGYSAVNTGLTGERGFSSKHSIAGVVMVCVIAASYISNSWDIVGSAEVRRSPAWQRSSTITDILEENTRSSIGWDINIQIHGIRGHVYALNTSQSINTVRNTSHKQDIRVCNRTEVVVFWKQNFSEILHFLQL